jgi:hypothetical protein
VEEDPLTTCCWGADEVGPPDWPTVGEANGVRADRITVCYPDCDRLAGVVCHFLCHSIVLSRIVVDFPARFGPRNPGQAMCLPVVPGQSTPCCRNTVKPTADRIHDEWITDLTMCQQHSVNYRLGRTAGSAVLTKNTGQKNKEPEMDYGHALEFGAFITPTNSQPQTPVALAQLSEQLGFDLVTFQDHPYQPAFFDTWTLLSYIAAATSTIRLAPNVLNLPLRPPAVLARAATSLDLLSDGRFELGLGAGAFWDAIEAMGGRRLTPGQALEALEEAIDLIRGIWNPDDRRRLPSESTTRWLAQREDPHLPTRYRSG